MAVSSKSLPPLPPCPSNLFDQGNTNHGAAQECSFLLCCRNSADCTDWCLGRLMASGFCELNSHGYLRSSWVLQSLAPAFFHLFLNPPIPFPLPSFPLWPHQLCPRKQSLHLRASSSTQCLSPTSVLFLSCHSGKGDSSSWKLILDLLTAIKETLTHKERLWNFKM